MDIDRVDAVTVPATGMRFLVVKALDGKEGPSLDELLDKAQEDDVWKADRDKLHEQAEERAKKYGIEFKDGKGHLTPPKGKPTDPEQYADPVNYAYPIDEGHIRAAVSYFNQDGQREAGGYTTEEWAIIGKRIAAAANKLLGDGYKYEDGKIVTPNNQGDKGEAKKAAGNPDDASTPGSAAWEQADVDLMQRAVNAVMQAQSVVEAIRDREKAEAVTADPDDWDQVQALEAVLDALAFALKELAGALFVEQAEAEEKGGGESTVANSVTKAGRVMSKANMQKVHQAMTHIANAAGFKSIQHFHDTCKSMGICDEDEDRPDEEPTGEDDTTKARKPDKPAEDDAQKGRTVKSAAGESPAAEAVIKALEATGLTTMAKSAGELLEAAKVIKSLEERVQALENQPMPGGPMLRGAANAHDYYLVRKGDAPDLADTRVLEQAMNQVQSPYLRDILSREAARRLHPAAQK